MLTIIDFEHYIILAQAILLNTIFCLEPNYTRTAVDRR